MNYPTRCTLLATIIFCMSPALVPAAQPGDAMPAGTLLYIGWPGADALGEASNDTAWGKLMAEPEIVTVRARWNEEIWPAIDRLIRQDIGRKEGQAYEPAVDLLAAAWKNPTALGFAGVDIAPEGPRVDVALVIQTGADAKKLAAAVEAILKVALGPNYSSAEVEVGDATLREIQLPEVGWPLSYGVLGENLVVSIGTKFPEHWAAGADAKPLAGTERFSTAMKVTGASEVTPVFFLDLRGVVETLEKFQPMFASIKVPILGEPGGVQKLLENIGLGSVQSYSAAMRPEAGGFTTTSFLHAPELGEGAGELLVQKPLSDEDLKVVPRDVSFASITNIDLAAAYRSLRSAFQAVAPDACEAVMSKLAEFERQIGVRIEQDLLASFADTWAIYDAPEHGGLWFTGIVAVVELRDGNKLDDSLEKLVKAIAEEIGDKYPVTIREEGYRDHKIRFINVANAPMPLAPAWATVGNRCVMGFYPQMVRAGIDHLTAKGPTLLDNADFQRGRKQMPEQFSSISYTDTRDGVRFLYSIAVPLGTALMNMAQGEGIPLDAGLLPSSRTVTRHLFGNVSASTTTKEGVLSVSHGAIPIPIPVASAAGGVAMTSMMTAVLLPSLARAREMARRTTSAANLQGIAVSCLTYAAENRGKLPPDLQTLTEGGKRAYLLEKQLKSPRDQSPAEISYVYVKGQKNTMDPHNVIAYEDPDLHDTSDGLNVAFLDGSVKWMPMDEFKEQLKATRKRIEAASDAQDGNKAQQGSNAPPRGRRRAPTGNSKVVLARAMVADDGVVAIMIKIFRMNMGRYPESLEELTRVPDDEQEQAKYGKQPYLRPAALEDPWGNKLRYKYPGHGSDDSFDLFSLGPDGKESEDDIGNWDTRKGR